MYTLLRSFSGYTLKHLRGDRGVAQIAARAGVSPEVWQRWEKGHELPPEDQSELILQSLECTEDEIEQTILTAAEAVREMRRMAKIGEIDVPKVGQIASAVTTLQQGNLVILETLERMAGNQRLQRIARSLQEQEG